MKVAWQLALGNIRRSDLVVFEGMFTHTQAIDQILVRSLSYHQLHT